MELKQKGRRGGMEVKADEWVKRGGGVGGGGGQVRGGHVCKRDKTSSFHFD